MIAGAGDKDYSMLFKKPRYFVIALAGLVVAVAAIIVWMKWKDSDLLDYRKHFSNRAAMTHSGCFVIAPKPATRPNGTLYFLHNIAKKSSSGISSSSGPEQFQIMKFNFEDWELSKIADLPAQPAGSRMFLQSADKAGENFILGIFLNSNGVSTSQKALYNAQRGTMPSLDHRRAYRILGSEVIGLYEDATMTPSMYRTDIKTLKTEPWVLPLDLETSRIIRYHSPFVVNPEIGPFYFTVEYMDAGTTQSRIYRCDHLDAKPVVATSYPPPYQVPAPGGRYPFDYLTQALHFKEYNFPLSRKSIKIPYSKIYNTGDMKHALTEPSDANAINTYWEIWSGTIEQWNENKPCLNLNLGVCRNFNPAGLCDFKRLARFRNTESLGGWSTAVSPDGNFVIFAQILCNHDEVVEEALMAIDINTGACNPVLMHKLGDHSYIGFYSPVYQ